MTSIYVLLIVFIKCFDKFVYTTDKNNCERCVAFIIVQTSHRPIFTVVFRGFLSVNSSVKKNILYVQIKRFTMCAEFCAFKDIFTVDKLPELSPD